MSEKPAEAIDFCAGKVAPAGSSLYYSLLFQTPADKPALLALHAFHTALSDIILECTDSGVAHIRLAWWQEELQMLQAGKARHPVSQVLAAQTPGTVSIPDLGHLVLHYEQHIDLQQPASHDELIAFLHRGPGCYWELLARLTGAEDPRTVTVIGNMGVQFSYFRLLQELPEHIAGQRCYLPRDEMENAGNDTTALYTRQLLRLENALDQQITALPAVDSTNQLHALVLAHIICQTSREIRHSGSQLGQQRLSLTPLRKLWIAWRCKRRYC